MCVTVCVSCTHTCVPACHAQVESAILKLHSRRVCCLAFPPLHVHDRFVMSGDKKGGICMWDMDKVGVYLWFCVLHIRYVYSFCVPVFYQYSII